GVSAAFRAYALVLLMSIYTLNFLDRQVVNILVEKIKADLHLYDWQIGALAGLSFAALYTVLGFPVARAADRGDRPLIIGVAIAIWSGCTALCGLTQNFAQLVAARVGVGIGEAGCTPPAVSLITDYTPPDRRASAMAFYTLGGPVGLLIGMSLGGVAADAWGWRAAFLIVGLPGVVLSVVALVTLVEPRRKLAAALRTKADETPSLAETFREISGKRALWLILFAASIKAFAGFGGGAFTAPFFLRNHGGELAAAAASLHLQSTGLLGLVLGFSGGLLGIVGVMVGGVVADRLGARDKRAYVSIPAVAGVFAAPLSLAALMTGSFVIAVVLMSLSGLLDYLWFGPTFAALQSMVRPRSRAMVVALQLLMTNVIGLGLGPLGVGLISDLFTHQLNLGPAQGVRFSLVAFVFVGLIGNLLFWMARRTIREEIVS
ncbi:MAG TPA: MFS transporter, partial [Caulobacteraceae bacterium]|nr:MFS transporter [Caulobacteraceae bacterium]